MDDPLVERWAASGAMALTGLPDEPLGPPARLVEGVDRLAAAFPGLDCLALLGERAALMGLWRRGGTSCGGSCRLLAARDGWLAVSLPRGEDLELVPAWLELDSVPASTPGLWSAVKEAIAGRDPDELLARSTLLGLPVSRVGEEAATAAVTRYVHGSAPARALGDVLIVDLSALWAGPLCGDLLAGAGATVVKVESTARPDGARRGPRPFFDLLNGHKRSVALDFTSNEGVRALRLLVQRADVVIEASRPRALEQFGIHAADAVRGDGPQVWISITGHGRTGDAGARVGFGDDAAAAGGLVVWHGQQPLFCADAVGDPLTGLTAAGACLEALAQGVRCVLDVSMAGVCAGLAGPTLPVSPTQTVAEPRARTPKRSAPTFGDDTTQVLEELDLQPLYGQEQ